jgi:hypothetical protein
MQSFGTFDLTNYFPPAQPLQVTVSTGLQYVRLINNSPYLLQVIFTGAGNMILPEMWLEDIPVPASFVGTINITPVVNLSNASESPSFILGVVGWGPGELTQPANQSIPLLSNIGNTVHVMGSGLSATNIINDGNPAGTQIIESTASGDANSAVTLNNIGNLVLGNATHPGSISSDNGGVTTDGNSNLTVEGNVTVEKNIQLFDNSHVAHLFATINASTNDNTVAANSVNNVLHLTNSSLSDIVELDGNFFVTYLLGTLALKGTNSIKTVNGTSAGTVTFVLISVTPVILLVFFSGYNNTTSIRQQFSLSTIFPNYFSSSVNAFSNGAFFWIGGVTNPNTSGVYFRDHNNSLVTTNNYRLAGTLSTGTTNRVQSLSVGEVYVPFHLFELDGSLSGVSSGVIGLFGN